MVDANKLLDSPSYFVRHYLGEEPFEYQEDFMDHPSNRKAFVSGRRVGKSRTASWMALWKAVTYPDTEVLVTAKAQRQSMELFNQIQSEMRSSDIPEDQWGVTRATRTEINFDNGSRIIALPVGRDGSNIRGYGRPNNMIIVDEAAFIPDEIFQQVLSPMLAVGEGQFILLSTPFGKKGFLYTRFNHEDWYTKQVPTSYNPMIGDDFIEEQRETLTSMQFKQEILGQFEENADAFFTREELLNCAHESVSQKSNITYLGVDLASTGGDESVYVCMDDDGNVFNIEHTSDKPMTDAMGRIRELDSYYDFKKILVDSTSLGQGTVDQVKESLGNKVEGFKFSNEKKQSLYNTVKTHLQNGEIAFEYVPPGENGEPGTKMFNQCLELEYSYTSSGKMRIHHPTGGHDDFSDALALAIWAKSRKNLARSDASMRPFTLGSLK